MNRTRILMVLLVLALTSVPALAQGNSSLQGTVSDPSGAVIPGATIEIVNVATSATMSAESDEVGTYRFPQVVPGTYNLRATSEGLVSVGIPNIALLVNQPTTINVTFTDVGSITEIVSVQAETAQINTVDASMGNAVGTRPILQLPFEARNVVNLLALQPGVAYSRDTVAQVDDTRHGSVNGGRSDQANITLDGADVNDQSYGAAFESVLRVTLDSVQEFRTTTLNAGADQGRSSGAQVALVTKSGTNELHGSAYWYHRNTATTANDFFLNSQGSERPNLLRNIFGASIGGPIKKNRLFYFFNYEGRTDRSEESAVRTVPSAEFRNGIFQYLRDDFSVRAMSPQEVANEIDPLGLGPNPEVLKYMQQFPLPNDDTVGDGLNRRGYRFTGPVTRNDNTYIGRADYYIDQASKHQIFGRVNFQDDENTTIPQYDGGVPRYTYVGKNWGLAVGYTATFTPTLFNSLRYGMTVYDNQRQGASEQAQVEFRRFDELIPLTRTLNRKVPVHTISDDVSWLKGNHQFKFGGVIRLIGNERVNYANSYNTAVVNSSWMLGSGNLSPEDTSDAYRRNAQDAMAALLGMVSQGEAKYNYLLDGQTQPTGSPVLRNFQQQNYEFYFMDTWRIARGLTLTAGLRWHLHPPIYEKDGYQTSSIPNLEQWFNDRGDLASQGLGQTEAGSISYVLKDDPQGRGLYPYHKKNFEPRVALAYSPQVSDGFWGKLFGGPGKTSVRGGFGMFYDNFGQSIIRLYDSEAYGLSTSLQSPPGGFSIEDVPRFTGLNDIPGALIPPAPPGGFPASPAPESFSITNSIDGNLKSPYSMALNFSIGRELPRNFFIEGSYVGRLSRRTISQRDLAQPTNLVDPESGQDYYSAVNQLSNIRDNGVSVESAPSIPWFDNMMPDAANYFIDGTPTQNMLFYMQEYFEPYIAWGGPYDYISVQADMDQGWLLPANKAGRYSMFNDQYSAMAAWSSIGHGNYHAAQLTLRKRFSDGLQFDLNYTFSKSLDLASAAEQTGAYTDIMVNSFNPWQMKSVSDYDMRHQVNVNFLWELPFGSGKKWGSGWNGATNAILGGWQLSGLWRQTTGLPTNINNGATWPTNWNTPGFATQIGPNPTQGITKNAAGVDGTSGPNIFADPKKALESWTYSRAGESGQRNGVRGDGYFTVDLGLGKRFMMPWEGHSVQFRWEVFNVSNTAKFDVAGQYWAIDEAGTFGKYSYMLTNARVMQFALRYEF